MTIIFSLNRWGGNVVVKTRPGGTEAAMANQYKGEQQMGSIFNLFALLAVFFRSLLIAWVTVSYESIKAGVANPVKSLRSE